MTPNRVRAHAALDELLDALFGEEPRPRAKALGKVVIPDTPVTDEEMTRVRRMLRKKGIL